MSTLLPAAADDDSRIWLQSASVYISGESVRVLIIAGRWLVAVLGLSVLCIVLALGFFNPNARRDDIEAWVSEQTGRSFTLGGELGWQVWQPLAVTLPHIRLAEAPGTPKTGDALQPFAEWQRARFSLRLWPLIRGRLELGAVQVSGLRLRLQRDVSGRDNWQDLLQWLDSDQSPSRFKFSHLDQLQIDDAQITFDDVAAHRKTLLRIESLNTTAVAFNRPIEIVLKAQASTQVGADTHASTDTLNSQAIELPFTLALQIQTDELRQRWQLDDIQVVAHLTATGVLGDTTINALPMTLRLQQAAWQAGQPLVLTELGAAIGEVQLALQLTMNEGRLTTTTATPQVSAAVQVAVPNLRQWLQRLTIEVPMTRDATVLQRLAAQLQIAGSAQDLRLQLNSLQLDQTRLSGEARVQHIDATPRYFAELHADRLDLDRYLPVATAVKREPRSASPVPIDWLRTLHTQGQLRIDQARWQAIRAQQLTITLDGT